MWFETWFDKANADLDETDINASLASSHVEKWWNNVYL
jgi:hypothetical protein